LTASRYENHRGFGGFGDVCGLELADSVEPSVEAPVEGFEVDVVPPTVEEEVPEIDPPPPPPESVVEADDAVVSEV
jgi:hypothetical protein